PLAAIDRLARAREAAAGLEGGRAQRVAEEIVAPDVEVVGPPAVRVPGHPRGARELVLRGLARGLGQPVEPAELVGHGVDDRFGEPGRGLPRRRGELLLDVLGAEELT